MMDQGSRRPLPPSFVALLPRCRAAQRQVHFLGFMKVARVVGGWTENQKTAGDLLAGPGTALTQDLGPSVIVEKSAIQIVRGIGLPPGQGRCLAAERRHQIIAESRRVAGDA